MIISGVASLYSISLASLGASLQTLYLTLSYTGVARDRGRILVLGALVFVVFLNLFPFLLFHSFNMRYGAVDMDWSSINDLLAVGATGSFGGGTSGGAAFTSTPVNIELSGFYVLDRDLEPVYRMPHYAYSTTGVSWSPDGRLLAIGTGEGKVIIASKGTWSWSLLDASPARITGLDWCNETLYFSDELGYVYTYNTSTGQIDAIQVSIYVSQIACDPGGKMVAVGAGNGELLVVDAKTLNIEELLDAGSPISGIAWSPGGDKLAVTRSDGVVMVIWLDEVPRIVSSMKLRTPDVWSGTPRAVLWIGGDDIVVANGDGIFLMITTATSAMTTAAQDLTRKLPQMSLPARTT